MYNSRSHKREESCVKTVVNRHVNACALVMIDHVV